MRAPGQTPAKPDVQIFCGVMPFNSWGSDLWLREYYFIPVRVLMKYINRHFIIINLNHPFLHTLTERTGDML